jgi:hypothetical protein
MFPLDFLEGVLSMKKLLVLAIGAAMLQVSGCGSSSSPAINPTTNPTPPIVTETGDDAHSHGAGPHGGALTDWGGGAYHVEFTVDHETKEATVYLVGSDEKSPSPIKADKIQLVIDDPMTEMELVAKPMEGESDGMSSRFVGTHETIGIVKEFSGTISGEIEGTPYTGDFQEEPHGADHTH